MKQYFHICHVFYEYYNGLDDDEAGPQEVVYLIEKYEKSIEGLKKHKLFQLSKRIFDREENSILICIPKEKDIVIHKSREEKDCHIISLAIDPRIGPRPLVHSLNDEYASLSHLKFYGFTDEALKQLFE